MTAVDELTEQQANRAFIRRFVEEVMNAGRLDLADEAFSPDCIVHVPGQDHLPPGPMAFKMVVGMWRAAFDDWHMVIDDLITEGDKVVKRFTTTGTHTGPLMGWAPTHKPFRIEGVVTFRMACGQVIESWVSDDLPGMLAQLGLLVAVPKGPFPNGPGVGGPGARQPADDPGPGGGRPA